MSARATGGSSESEDSSPGRIIVANQLDSGHIVYWSGTERWSVDRQQACLFSDAASDQELVSDILSTHALSHAVIGPECIKVDEHLWPIQRRDQIRCSGPTSGPVASINHSGW